VDRLDDHAAQYLADHRASALTAGDERAWLADLDPADPGCSRTSGC
jgi:hypothetical protein